MNLIKNLIDKLSNLFTKILYEKQIEYYMLTLFRNSNPDYLLCIDTTTSNYIYGKVVSINKVSTIDCIEAMYIPHGLFIFGRNIDEFVIKFINKLKIIK